MMDSLINQWVEVTYQEKPKKTQLGTLIEYDDEGQVTIRDKYSIFHYIWPCLHIEKRDRNASKAQTSE